MTILEKLAALEHEISITQKNKATSTHLGSLRAKVCKLRTELLTPVSKGPSQAGFEVGRYGDARVAIMGFPSVGKSSLLTVLTGVKSEAAAYEFTTLTCIPGVIYFNDSKIQLLDLPGIIDGAADGKGRGRQVIATAKSADLILMVLDATKDDTQKNRLEKEMESVGIRLNKSPPNIKITKKPSGGVRVNASVQRTYLDDKTVEAILREYRIFNCDVVIREDATHDEFIDILEGNRKYARCVYCYNKIDQLSLEQMDRKARLPHAWVLSCTLLLNIEELKRRIWEELELVRIYTKKKVGVGLFFLKGGRTRTRRSIIMGRVLNDLARFPDFQDPLVITPQRGTKECTVENAVTMLHKEILEDFKCALVWGRSVEALWFLGVGRVAKEEQYNEVKV